MNKYKLELPYFKGEVKLVKATYAYNDTLAVKVESDEDIIAVLTVCIDQEGASENKAFIDTNNVEWAEEFLTENGIACDTGIVGQSGFCEYPLYEFDLNKLD